MAEAEATKESGEEPLAALRLAIPPTRRPRVTPRGVHGFASSHVALRPHRGPTNLLPLYAMVKAKTKTESG